MSARIAIRADASLAIGSGHVMRCLSLAEALRARGAEVFFISRELPGHIHAQVRGQGYALVSLPPPQRQSAPRADLAHGHWLGVDEALDGEQTAAALGAGVDWLVVDHYALDRRWQRPLRAHARQIAVIDDLADRPHDADLLVDQNAIDDPQRYAGLVPPGCVRLLGPGYAMLRDEFVAARRALRPRDGALRRVLVFLGGVDAGGYTERAMAAPALLVPPPQVEVIVGFSNPRADAIRERCAELGFGCLRGVDDMAARMAAADLAVGAGGTTTWERACLGLPSVIVVVADNQRAGALAMDRAGCALTVEGAEASPERLAALLRALAADPARLRAMADANLRLVDGRGAARVARALLPPAVVLRRATAADCEAMHEWRNHEDVRRQSHDPAPIARDAHERWFARVLADPARELLIGEHEGRPVGVLRYDLGAAETLVSVYLVPGRSGHGYGPALLRAGSAWLRARHPAVRRVRAEVLPGNQASHKAFREAGYTLDGRDYLLCLQEP